MQAAALKFLRFLVAGGLRLPGLSIILLCTFQVFLTLFAMIERHPVRSCVTVYLSISAAKVLFSILFPNERMQSTMEHVRILYICITCLYIMMNFKIKQKMKGVAHLQCSMLTMRFWAKAQTDNRRLPVPCCCYGALQAHSQSHLGNE